MNSSLLLGITALTSLTLSAQEQAKEFKNDHFTVICAHLEVDSAGQATLDLLENLMQEQASLLGMKQPTLSKPITLHVHRYNNLFEIQCDERELTDEDKQKLWFRVDDEDLIHASMQPWLSPEVLEKYGPPMMFVQNLAVEASEMIFNRLVPQAERMPDWLRYGVQYVAIENVLREAKRLPEDLGQDPWFGNFRAGVARVAAGNSMPEYEAFLSGEEDFGERPQGLAWAWFRFMQQKKNKKRLDKLIADMLALPADDGWNDGLTKAVKKHFKASTSKKLNSAFNKEYRLAQRAAWTIDVHSVEILDDGVLTAAHAVEAEASPAIPELRPAKVTYTLSGKVTILPDSEGNQGAQLSVARGRGGFGGKRPDQLLAVLKVGAGVAFYEHAGEQWTTLYEDKEFPIEAGKTYEWAFESRKNRKMALLIDGKELFEFKTEIMKAERPLNGGWTIGAPMGGTALWQDITLK